MAKLPPLNALRCFEAAARHRSFSRAASELHVTQSAVSHQVRQLEDWFGVMLFERQGRQTVPTGKGETLASGLAEAFAIMQESCRQVKTSQAGATLTIAVLPSIATIWLIPKLAAFFKAHPEIPVKVVYLLAGQPLSFNDIDIAITWGTERSQHEGRATRLLLGDSVAVANPALIAREGPFERSHALLHAPLLHDTDRRAGSASCGNSACATPIRKADRCSRTSTCCGRRPLPARGWRFARVPSSRTMYPQGVWLSCSKARRSTRILATGWLNHTTPKAGPVPSARSRHG